MPYNGSGTYAAPASSFNPAVATTTINSTDWAALLADLTTALSTAICKDGQSVPTANLPMGGFKLTGLGAGTGAGNSVRYEQALLLNGANTMVGDLLFTDATYDIGKAGATRPRDLFTSRNLAVGGTAAVTGHVTLEGITSAGATGSTNLVFSASPTLTGSPLAPTQTAADNSTKIATTAYVDRGAASAEVLIGALQTASASGTIDFAAASYAAAFDGTLAEVTFHWQGVRPATDAQIFQMQIGTGAGPTYQAGGSDYQDAGNVCDGSTNGPFGTTRSYISLSGEQSLGNAVTKPTNGRASVDALNNTAFLKIFMYELTQTTSGGTLQRVSSAGQYKTAATAITGVRFKFVAGNIAEGIFWVTGKRKA